MRFKIITSPSAHKKWRAVFSKGQYEEVVDFGAKGMSDYTLNKDLKRKQMFLTRFRKLIHEYKDDPFSPMTLSTWILWNKPTLEESIKDFKKHFHLT